MHTSFPAYSLTNFHPHCAVCWCNSGAVRGAEVIGNFIQSEPEGIVRAKCCSVIFDFHCHDNTSGYTWAAYLSLITWEQQPVRSTDQVPINIHLYTFGFMPLIFNIVYLYYSTFFFGNNCTYYIVFTMCACFSYCWKVIESFVILSVFIYTVLLLRFALFMKSCSSQKNPRIWSFKVGLHKTGIEEFYIVLGCFCPTRVLFRLKSKIMKIFYLFSFSTQYHAIFLMDRRDKTFPGVSSVHMILYGQWETKYHRTVMVSQAWPWGAKRLPDCNPSPWCTNGLAHQAEPSPSPCAHWKWVMSLQLRSAGGPGLNRTAFCHANTGGDIWNRKTLHEYQTAPCFLAWHTSHFLELIISG